MDTGTVDDVVAEKRTCDLFVIAMSDDAVPLLYFFYTPPAQGRAVSLDYTDGLFLCLIQELMHSLVDSLSGCFRIAPWLGDLAPSSPSVGRHLTQSQLSLARLATAWATPSVTAAMEA